MCACARRRQQQHQRRRQLSFTDTESHTDNFVLNKTAVNSENANATLAASNSMTESGGTSAGSYQYNQNSQTSTSLNSSGNTTYSGIATPFALSSVGPRWST